MTVLPSSTRPAQARAQGPAVGGMQARRGLVEQEQQPAHPRRAGGGETRAPELAAGQGGAGAIQGEVREADVPQEVDARPRVLARGHGERALRAR